MSNEKPEDKWKREKQYQAPAPIPAGQPPVAQGDDTRWLQEKRGNQAAHPPGHGPGPVKPPSGGPEAQWLREKQAPPQNQPSSPATGLETQWLREKQGRQLPITQPGPDQQWLREKQGLPPLTPPPPGPGSPNRPPLPTQESGWQQAKVGSPAPKAGRSRSGLYLGLGLGAVILIVAIGVLAFILLSPKSSSSPTATSGPTATTGLTSTSGLTGSPASTGAPTTGSGGQAGLTTAPATLALPTLAVPTAPAATTISASDSARLVSLAEEAAKNSRWDEVIQSLELLDTADPNYGRAKPLLVKAYFQLGEQQVAQTTNNQESANRALINYRKANALDPGFAGLAQALHRAEVYAQGLLQFDSDQFSQAVDTLKPLYDEKQTEKEGVHYRNTANILYDALIKLGDNSFNLNSLNGLAQARAFYSEALALDVANKDLANSKLQQADRAIKLLSPVPTK